MKKIQCRHLVLILGDQLDEASSAFEGFDPAQDRVLMVEALEESTPVCSHKIRTTLFLSAMRHFAEGLRQRGWQVNYRALDTHADQTTSEGLLAAIAAHQPLAIVGVEPGDMRVRQQIENAVKSIAAGIRVLATPALKTTKTVPKVSANAPLLSWREDKHCLCGPPQFRAWAGQSSSLRMAFFYRSLRKQSTNRTDGQKSAAHVARAACAGARARRRNAGRFGQLVARMSARIPDNQIKLISYQHHK